MSSIDLTDSTKSKTCFKCGNIKPIDEFYENKRMHDGHLNKCKDCTKSDVKNRAIKESEYIKAYDAARYQLERDKRIKNARKNALENKDRRNEISRKWGKENRKKRAAHLLVKRKLIDSKPSECSSCGSKTNIQGHHADYSKPLDVEWLCGKCHGERHRKQIPDNFSPRSNWGKLRKVKCPT